jgi:hypothetical protein
MAKKDNAHFNEKWDDAMIYQIAADKAQGMTIKQLAAKYKMTQQQVKYVVYRRLKNENIERGLAITNVALKEAGVADAKPKTESVTITVTSAGMAAPDPVPCTKNNRHHGKLTRKKNLSTVDYGLPYGTNCLDNPKPPLDRLPALGQPHPYLTPRHVISNSLGASSKGWGLW